VVQSSPNLVVIYGSDRSLQRRFPIDDISFQYVIKSQNDVGVVENFLSCKILEKDPQHPLNAEIFMPLWEHIM